MAGYQVEFLHTEDYKTTEWSGGTTTELSISPKGSVYADRDFLWRLSSATVDVEKSEFTSLPDYDRIIMTLKGDISLSHNNDNWIDLPEFTPHAFDGKDETVSIGKVIDFNLMMRKGRCSGAVLPIRMEAGEGCDLKGLLAFDMPSCEDVMVYCYKGKMNISLEDGSRYELGKGDTLKLSGSFEGATWSCACDESVSAVVAAVRSL